MSRKRQEKKTQQTQITIEFTKKDRELSLEVLQWIGAIKRHFLEAS